MARIRTVKPEFWSSEQVMECQPLTRLLFIGIWNFCDDYGNHPMSAKTIKALVFPGDDITASEIQTMLAELSANSLIDTYQHDGKTYLHVCGWHHQKIDRPSRKYPEYSPNSSQQFDEHSTNDRPPIDEPSTTEGKGREGKGIDQEPAAAKATPKPKRKSALPETFMLTTDMAKWARDRAPAVNLSTETEKFCNHWRSKGETRADWLATWYNWMLRAQEYSAKRPVKQAEPDFDDVSWANDLGTL